MPGLFVYTLSHTKVSKEEELWTISRILGLPAPQEKGTL
jgi:hypothetical protein